MKGNELNWHSLKNVGVARNVCKWQHDVITPSTAIEDTLPYVTQYKAKGYSFWRPNLFVKILRTKIYMKNIDVPQECDQSIGFSKVMYSYLI